MTKNAKSKETASFLLRAVPRDLWLRFRARAKSQGMTARSALVMLILDYVGELKPKKGRPR